MKFPKFLKYGLITGGLLSLALGAFGIITNKPANMPPPSKLEQKITTKNQDPLEQFFTKRPVTYIDFENINYDDLPQEKISVPEDFDKRIRSSIFKHRIKDKNLLEEHVFAEAEKLGYSREILKKLPTKEAIKSCIDIVVSRLQYLDVDNDKEFIEKHGKFLSIENYFALGLGDCDKYAATFIAVFDIIKNINPNLHNVYAGNEDLGGNFITHAWNSLMFLTNNKTLITHIDTTRYDSEKELAAKKGYHIPEDDLEFQAYFFKAILSNNLCYEKFKKLYSKTYEIDEKGFQLSVMAFNSVALKDKEKLETVKCRYNELNAQGFKDDDLEATIIYGFFETEIQNNQKKAEAHYKELMTRFPGSFYTKMAGQELEITKLEKILKEYLEEMEKDKTFPD